MKLQYLTSASIILKDKNVKILCDPWLVDGEYYGSWYHYPPLNFKPDDFNDVDYIYLSHIHPDHSSVKTLKKMNKNIPILIHNYDAKFLKKSIESLGFKVLELDHNKRVHLKDNMYVNILAADNCDPQLCHRYFGCSIMETKFASTSIDSMAVFDNGNEVLVNTNDCPYPLANTSASIVKSQYPQIDMLLVGYTSASAFPQCFEISDQQKMIEKKRLQNMYVEYAEKYVQLLKPKYFFPFAGKYTLGGKLSNLNIYKGVCDLDEAFQYFSSSSKVDTNNHRCIVLNSGETFDISLGKSSKNYESLNLQKRDDYIQEILKNKKLDYEYEKFPSIEEIKTMIPIAYKRFEEKRNQLRFLSDTKIIIKISETENILVSCNASVVLFI